MQLPPDRSICVLPADRSCRSQILAKKDFDKLVEDISNAKSDRQDLQNSLKSYANEKDVIEKKLANKRSEHSQLSLNLKKKEKLLKLIQKN